MILKYTDSFNAKFKQAIKASNFLSNSSPNEASEFTYFLKLSQAFLNLNLQYCNFGDLSE